MEPRMTYRAAANYTKLIMGGGLGLPPILIIFSLALALDFILGSKV